MEKRMKKSFILKAIIAAMLLPVVSFGLGEGTSSADFLKIGVGARPSGMGGAYTAVADDANASFWNPAGITSIDRISITAMHLNWYINSMYEFASVVMPVDSMTNMGLSGNFYYVPSFDSTGGSMPSAPASYDFAGTITIAKNLGNLYTKDFTIGNISLGANLTYIKRTLVGIDLGTQFLVDFGMMANITDSLKFGLTAQNIGASMGNDPSPFDVRAGLAYDIIPSKDFALLLAGDIVKPVDMTNPDFQKWYFNLGTELKISNFAFIRAGYKFGQDDQSFTAGGGLAWPGVLTADYAFMPNSELGNTHRVSLSVKFGNTVPRPVVGAPQPPQKVTAIAGDKVVSIGWDPNPEGNIIGYNIYFKEKNGDGKYAKLNKEPIMEEAKFKAILNNDITYLFAVTAINNRNLESVYSSPIDATPKRYEIIKPAKVEGVMTKLEDKNIVVTWNSSSQDFVVGYNLYYKKAGDAKFKRLNQKMLRDTTATLAGLTPKVTYYFMATAVSKDGAESDYSEVATAVLPEEEYY
jgi:hypothetical protein